MLREGTVVGAVTVLLLSTAPAPARGGELAFLTVSGIELGEVEGLSGPSAVAVSPGGAQVYVAGRVVKQLSGSVDFVAAFLKSDL